MSTDQVALNPPLRGDGQGNYRILITGNSGTGKSTLGSDLESLLDIPLVSLDKIFWRPGWLQTPDDEFRSAVVAVLTRSEASWIVDGNYARKLGTLVQDLATDIIWLDPPLILYFPRLCYRTVLRLLKIAPPCSPGCQEDYREVFFSKKSILWWCLSSHRRIRAREAQLLPVEGIHVGGKRRRIGGWGRELKVWKRDVRDMVRAQ
ncbi:hypothetical protein EIP91_005610 [Steccherinum ochraceum]|uniref:Adenylate kinase n=1 Tax=Steccherinum ochraceum TaxID=92696 RepID=A0A4R0RFE6_9APHY|nr:hypothetical protein EIP91_005610 [Steccherinum ochraceum]